MKKIIALLLALVMVFGLVACAAKEEAPAADAPAADAPAADAPAADAPAADAPVEDEAKVYPTITMLGNDAATPAGLIGGFRGEALAKRGLTVEMWAYSEDKVNAVLASEELPDIMVLNREQLNELAGTGLFLCLDEYVTEEYIPHINANELLELGRQHTRDNYSGGTGELYGIPLMIGPAADVTNTLDTIVEMMPKLNWQYYAGIGYPEVHNMEDYLDVIEQMVEAYPEVDGEPTYGLLLENSIDAGAGYFSNAGMYVNFFGWTLDNGKYLVERNMATGETRNILSKDSLYYEALKWFNDAYNRGLLDPDSISNDFMTQWAKIRNTMGGGGTVMGWSPEGFHEVMLDDGMVCFGENKGTNAGNFLCVNAKTENLDAVLAYLDAVHDPEYCLEYMFGPEGDLWELDENGNARHTQAAFDWLEANGAYEGFPMSNGDTYTNIIYGAPISYGTLTSYGDGEGGYRHWYITNWRDAQSFNASKNANYLDWSEWCGYASARDWAEAEGQVAYVPALTLSTPDEEMSLTVGAISQLLINEGWKMVFAGSEAEFDAIWDQMVADCNELGAEDIYAWRSAEISAAHAAAQ